MGRKQDPNAAVFGIHNLAPPRVFARQNHNAEMQLYMYIFLIVYPNEFLSKDNQWSCGTDITTINTMQI